MLTAHARNGTKSSLLYIRMLDSHQYDKLKKIAEAYKLLAQATLRAGGQKKQSTTIHKNLKVLELELDEYGVKQETSTCQGESLENQQNQ